MSTRAKWAISILVAASALFAILLLLRAATPFESHVLSAKRIELTAWSSYWDGGSRSFAFELPNSRHMVIFVPTGIRSLAVTPISRRFGSDQIKKQCAKFACNLILRWKLGSWLCCRQPP